MNTAIKILLSLLLLTILGYGATLLWFVEDDSTMLTGPGTYPREPDEPKKENPFAGPPTKGPYTEVKGGGTKDPKVPKPPRAPLGLKDFAQGVEGRIVDRGGYPVSGAKVYLTHGLGMKAFVMLKQKQEGVVFKPLAEGESGSDGSFRLGIRAFEEGNVYELRILHEKFCDHVLPNIQIQPMDWWNSGDINLKRGVAVYGHVASPQRMGVQGAEVRITFNQGMIIIAPTPGREDGLKTKTDAMGNYRFEHIDPMAVVTMTVEAQGFAGARKDQIHIAPERANEVNFELSLGFSIAGQVVGPTGELIKNAQITAVSLSRKINQAEETTTDAEGRFEVKGLKAGQYSVTAKAPEYVEHPEKPIAAGTQDLLITLERMGAVEVQVLGRNGTSLRNYHLNVKRHFPGQDHYGNAVQSKSVKGAKNGTTILTGIQPSHYVVEVFADKYAKAFSSPFEIIEGQQKAPRVVVQLDAGGAMRGKVVNSSGKPVSGVKVSTLPNGLVQNKLTDFFPIPYKITKRTVTTDDNGIFHFSLLYTDKYQIKLKHPEYCGAYVNDIEVVKNQTSEVATISLTKGCVVSGTTRVNGQLKGQVKVTASRKPDEESKAMFSTEAVSDNDGLFVLGKRLPPGTYECRYAEVVQSNPLAMMFEFAKNKQDFVVGKHKETHVLHINVVKVAK